MNRASLAEAIAVTAEVCQTELSGPVLRIMVTELLKYPEKAVIEALERCRREVKVRLTLAAIIERIDDGRPTAAEAYAMLPADESASAVLTEETLRAWGVCADLLGVDNFGARQAFTAAYEREVKEARALGEPVKWVPSLGHDPDGHARAIADAYERDRISSDQVARILTPEQAESVGLLPIMEAVPMLPGSDTPPLPELTPDEAAAKQKEVCEMIDNLKRNLLRGGKGDP